VESFWLSVISLTLLAARPPEAKPLILKVANGKPEAFRTGGGKAAIIVTLSKPDRKPKHWTSQDSVEEKPVPVVIHAQMTVAANQ